MTGEVTLRGRVTAIGGLKEKLLAALRSGVKTVLIPQENEKDLADIPDNVKDGLEIIPVSTMDEVLAKALDPRADADRMVGGRRAAVRSRRRWRRWSPCSPTKSDHIRVSRGGAGAIPAPLSFDGHASTADIIPVGG